MNEARKFITTHNMSLPEIHAQGWILDLGGGGEGMIGQLCGEQVVSIDRLRQELEEAHGSALKIVMDAGEMQFLDATFATAASFFFFFFVPPGDRARVFGEVYRVFKPGGRWLVWDASVPDYPGGEQDIYVMRLNVLLPDGREINTGYGTLWPQQRLNAAELVHLASTAGFETAACSEDGLAFALELRKPQLFEQAPS